MDDSEQVPPPEIAFRMTSAVGFLPVSEKNEKAINVLYNFENFTSYPLKRHSPGPIR